MKKLIVFLMTMTCLFAMSWAQESTGNIFGKILLADGAALPGVTVTLTGDVYGKATAVSSVEGNYRFMKLSPGVYSVKFELEGFKPVNRGGIRVSLATAQQLNVVMEPGTIQEAIEVVGRAGLIDTRKVSVAANVTSDSLRTLPISRNPVDVINMAPGILAPKPVVGGSSYGSWFAGFGTIGFKTEFAVDGATYGGTNYPGEPPGNSWRLNSERIEETKITTTGMDIHAVVGGANINFVSKRGGNKLSGAFYLNVIDGSLISTKPFPVSTGQKKGELLYNWKYGVSLGGPILKNHLWYYFSYGLVDNYTQNLTTLKTSRPLNFDLYAKGNFQIFGNTTGEFSYQKSKYDATNAPFIHSQEAFGINEKAPTEVYSAQLNTTLDKLMLSAKFTLMKQSKKQITPGTEQYFVGDLATGTYNIPGRYYIYDYFYANATQNIQDAAICSWVYTLDQQKRPYFNVEANYFAEKLLGGDHELLLGFESDNAKLAGYYWAPNQMFVRIVPSAEALNGRYNSWFGTYGGSKGLRASERQGIYFQDIMSYSRLAVTVGVRFDRMRWKWDPVTMNGIQINGSPVTAWDQWTGDMDVAGGQTKYINTFSPRISATYDLTGDGKNLIKASFANYAGAINNLGFRNGFKAGYLRGEFSLPFNDLNGNKIPDVGEYDVVGITPDEIDRRKAIGQAEQAAWALAHPGVNPPQSIFTYPQWSYYAFSGNRLGKKAAPVPTDFLADDYSPDRVLELTLGYEKMLSENIAVSAIGSYKKEYNGTWARGYTGTPDNYTLIPVQNMVVLGTDPTTGWDIYGTPANTVIPSPAGYVVTNYKKVYDDFYGLQLLFKKKLANHWMLDSSLSLTRWINHRSLEEQPRDTLWDYYDGGVFSSANYGSGGVLANSVWAFKMQGLYQLPYDIVLSGSIDGRQGFPCNIWVAKSSISSITLPKKGTKYGDERLPDVWTINAKLSKMFKISETVNLDTYVLCYNLFDAMTTLLYNMNEVPTTKMIGNCMDGRTFEIGFRFTF